MHITNGYFEDLQTGLLTSREQEYSQVKESATNCTVCIAKEGEKKTGQCKGSKTISVGNGPISKQVLKAWGQAGAN